MAKETKQASETWTCKCPRELPVRVLFCSRCNTSRPKKSG